MNNNQIQNIDAPLSIIEPKKAFKLDRWFKLLIFGLLLLLILGSLSIILLKPHAGQNNTDFSTAPTLTPAEGEEGAVNDKNPLRTELDSIVADLAAIDCLKESLSMPVVQVDLDLDQLVF